MLVTAESKRRKYQRELAVFEAWHCALFTRTEKFPSLESVLKTGEEREQTPEQIYDWAVAFTKSVGGKIISRSQSNG